jgi:hypothetical protein
MSEQHTGKLRIYADFNSCMEDDRGVWCWLLRHNGILLDEVAATLNVQDGLAVTLYYEDPGEEFEVDAVLGHIAKPGWDAMWMALPDWNTYRRRRG